jgi:TonB family protein
MRIVAMLYVVLSMPAWSFSQCLSSHVDPGRDYGASVYVSIGRSDFGVSNIACLARNLRTSRQDRASFSVLFFTSHEAALNFLPTPLETQHSLWARWASQLHAAYYWNADKQEEYLEIYPVGFEGSPSYNTQIDLRSAVVDKCRLQVVGRCAIILEPFNYPRNALKKRVSGQVTLTGTISRDGTVRSIRREAVDGDQNAKQNLLASAAIQNLSKWQLDPGTRSEKIRVRYVFELDTSIAGNGQTQITWDLPNQVVVRASLAQ